MVEGFKCFDKGLVNRYGTKFEIGKAYHADGIIHFGNKELYGNGFHMCKNMEDTFRYFNANEKEVDVCSCIGWGSVHEVYDDYNGFNNMYACEYIQLIKLFKRKEVIEYILSKPDYRIKRFISLYKLTLEEIEEFEEKFKDSNGIIKAIKYYQRGDKTVYNLKGN